MSPQPRIDLTIRYGAYGQKSQTVSLSISESLMHELMEPVELSDEPISLFLATPGVFGGRGDAATIRERTFKMRRELAEEIAASMVPALLRAFGINDQRDGYKMDELSEDRRTPHA
jgi:hypothetical protein